MRSMRTPIAILLAVTLPGCAAMRQDPHCRWAMPVWGAVAGGTGAGLGVGLGSDHASDGEIAGAAVGGTLAGGALGWLVGHYICEEKVAEAAPPPPPPPPPVHKKVELQADTYFDFNKATLKPEGKEKLDDVVREMKADPRIKALVEGHTDSIGSEAYNQKLSERRANAVADYMESKGIDSSRITTKGWGKTKPVASNKTKEGRAQNRRVEITED
jgi:outer membrane protein OmpA-like peptidoglycan-associated protein